MWLLKEHRGTRSVLVGSMLLIGLWLLPGLAEAADSDVSIAEVVNGVELKQGLDTVWVLTLAAVTCVAQVALDVYWRAIPIYGWMSDGISKSKA